MKKRRIFSLCVTLALCLGLLPTVQVQAAGTPEIAYQDDGYYITRTLIENIDGVGTNWVGERKVAFKEGVALVYTNKLVKTGYGQSMEPQYFFIDKTGNITIQMEGYESVHAFSEGLAVVKKGGKWGYIDKTGALSIPCIYEAAKDFSEGMASVTLNGLEGFIDKTGKVVLPIQNAWAESFSNGLAKVRRTDGGIEVINQSGAVVISNDEVLQRFTVPQRVDFSEDTASALAPLPYMGPITGIYAYSEGLMPTVYLDKEANIWYWGYADKTGEIALKLPDYDIATYKDGLWWPGDATAIAPFSEGLAITYRNGLYGFIDKTGKEVIAPQFEDVVAFSDGMAAVRAQVYGGKWGFIDRKGNLITSYQYQYDHPKFDAYFSDGLAQFKQEDNDNYLREHGYMDKTGKTVLNGYVETYGFNEGLAMAREITDHGDQWYILEKVSTASGPTSSSLPTAYAATQTVRVDGRPVEFQAYALKEENGDTTNYVKLRDVANVLNDTAAQFQVGYDGAISITTGKVYTPNGSEMNKPFSGNHPYQASSSTVKVDGAVVDLSAIVLTDDTGGGYTYFKLRDLGASIGFNVGWSAEQGIYIETDKPYSE